MTKSITRRTLIKGAGAASAALVLPSVSRAAEWRPTQTVKIMVAYPPGGLTDVMGRLAAQHLQSAWRQSVIVENKAGASGTIGALEFVRSKPDGHSLFVGNPGPNAIASSIFRNAQFKPQDFLPAASLIRVANIVSCNPNLPAKSIGELIAHIKTNPEKISYASSGLGQTPHLTMAWFLQLVGHKMVHAPFRGASPALAAVLGGQVDVLSDNLFPTLPQVTEKKLRALAVTSSQRIALAPDVPTMKESAPELANFEITSWFGLCLPAGASPDIVNAVNAEINKMLATDDFKRRMAEIGAAPTPQTTAEFAAFVAAEGVKYAEIIRKEGLELDPA
jgi:tripartite-type tricarboxylate transporter receptor subunit TctC